MKSFILGGVSATALIALTSFAYWTGRAAAGTAVRQQVGPIRLADLPLNRSFQTVLPLTNQSATLSFPPTAGIAITQVAISQQASPCVVNVTVNGALVVSRLVMSGLYSNSQGASGTDGVTLFDPPIVVPAGSTLAITACGSSINIGGWTLGLGDV